MPRQLARRQQVRRQLRSVVDDEFRPDIEGLRALAVVAVVLFHLRLDAFRGGFVGVDVFFVLSGFLITRLLLGELAAMGTLSLPGFWARRARRLLPASFVVIAATLLFGRVLLSPLAQRDLAVDAVASGAFVVNFVFANRLDEYFAAQLAEAQPSPLLHYWSLAVEEQFYLVWPLVLVALARRPRQYRRLLLTVILGVALASLCVSVWLTDRRPTWAFYLLPARTFELLAGAALAVAGPAFRAVNANQRAALGWFGLFGIAVAVLTYDTSTAFPGTAALLPVLATVLVVVAGGTGAAAHGPVVALRHPAAQWTGRHSYEIYLWHWPALVLFDARYGPLPLATRVAIVTGSVGLAAVSFRVLENPVRRSPWLAARPARGLALGATLCVAAVGGGVWLRSTDLRLHSGEVAAAPTLAAPTNAPAANSPTSVVQPAAVAATTTASPPVTLAALEGDDVAALVDANSAVLAQGLAQTNVPSNLRPALMALGGDRAEVYSDDCVAIGVETELTPCRYGDENAARTMVLYGDSHAAQWFPALQAIADERGYELIVLAKGGCPTAEVSIPTATLARTCPIWRDAAIEFIAERYPDVVVVGASAAYSNSDEEWAEGFAATMARLRPSARNVVVLGDTPRAGDEPTECLSRHLRSADDCASRRDDVVAASRLAIERQIAVDVGATFVDTTDWLCTEAGCPMIIGDILLYRDATHITTVAAAWFRPLLEASLEPSLP